MSWDSLIFAGLVALVVVVILSAIFFTESRRSDFAARCQAERGVAVYARDAWVCFKADAVLFR